MTSFKKFRKLLSNLVKKSKNGYQNIKKSLHKRKEKIIFNVSIIMGVIFIIGGVLSLGRSPEKIADNVIFGEEAMLAALLIIIGVLLIGAVTIQSVILRTPLNDIYKKMKAVEEDKNKEKDKKD